MAFETRTQQSYCHFDFRCESRDTRTWLELKVGVRSVSWVLETLGIESEGPFMYGDTLQDEHRPGAMERERDVRQPRRPGDVPLWSVNSWWIGNVPSPCLL